MSGASRCLLAVNAGSSSIRFAVYEAGEAPRRRLSGTIDRIGERNAALTLEGVAEEGPRLRALAAADHLQAAAVLLDWLEAQPAFASVEAAGHRVVHGRAGRFAVSDFIVRGVCRDLIIPASRR